MSKFKFFLKFIFASFPENNLKILDLCFKNIIVIIIENVSNWESLVNNRIIKTDEHADNAANEEI